MRRLFIATASAALVAACGGSAARTPKPQHDTAPAAPEHYTYVVRNAYPHDTDRYTQGLQYVDGELWEGTGEYGRSRLLRTDLATGRTHEVARLPRSEFGEGIAVLGDRVYQLTWQENKAYVYDRRSGARCGEFRYPGEGWGLTTDGTKLYMSDGTEYIHTVDPETFRRERSVAVTLDGAPVRMINELEWIDGKIWANVYLTEQLAVIDPATGRIEGIVDLTGLLPEELREPDTDVLNGIAWDEATGRIFVTGKRWCRIYEIETVKK